MELISEYLSGVWSAVPTPFKEDMSLDYESVERMVEHHLRLGVKGLFLAGTCGEGPWLPDRDRLALLQAVTECAGGRLAVACQVTDNSAARILDNMAAAYQVGADIAVIAPPYILFNGTPENILNLYREAIRNSPLPVGIYDRGQYGSVVVPTEILPEIYAEEKVVIVKDSSGDAARREAALAAKAVCPQLKLFNGSEFDCVSYLEAGYDGLLLGGGVFNGYMAAGIMAAAADGDMEKAGRLQERMNRIMWDVYGGKQITCWLTGLKHLLVEMGIFNTRKSYLNYPLTDECRRAIADVLVNDRDMLFPWEAEQHG